MTRWRNWSGSVEFRPRQLCCPRREDELADLVADVHARGGSVRVVGSGHSATGIVSGEDTLVSLQHLDGVIDTDRAACTATVGAGSTLETIGSALHDDDLALPNYGDVATQTIGGAIGTGTHGSGAGQHNLSHLLVGARLVDGRGEVHEIHAEDCQSLCAARVALGTLGIFTRVKLQLVPAFDVQRREYATGIDSALAHLDELVTENYSFDFYWYPRRDDAKLRLVNPVGGGTLHLPYARLLERRDGYGHLVIPTHSGIPHRFEECEYVMPAGNGPDCFRSVRQRVLERWRSSVGWRVLYRTVAADDSWLSPASGRDSVTISLHQNASLPWCEYFDDIQPVFREFGGRPHWAKKHGCTARELEPMYPHWQDFLRQRARFDPDGTFLNPYLRTLLGVAA